MGYKDCFKLMDINKDGQLDKNDLRGAFDNVGVLMTEGELDGLLGEIGGACTYDNMVKMFQEKMAGDGNDSDDLIVQAFKAYDQAGKIDSKMFQHALMTWGDKMTKDVVGLFVAVKEEPKAEEPAPVVEEAAPEEEDEEEEEGRQVNNTLLLAVLYEKKSWLTFWLCPVGPANNSLHSRNLLKIFELCNIVSYSNYLFANE